MDSNDHSLPSAGGAAAVLLFFAIWLLGAWGWWLTEPAAQRSVVDVAYKGLQLFSLNFDNPGAPIHWLLQLVRFAAPLFTITTVAAALSSQLRSHVRALHAWKRDHYTLLGYGAIGRAAASWIRRRQPRGRIVAIDRRVSDEDRRAGARSGVELMEANAMDSGVQSSFTTGLRRSGEVVIACGSDEINLALLDRLIAGRARSRRIWVHLDSHALAERLRESYAEPKADAPLIEFVEQADSLALAMLLAHPLAVEARAAGLKRVHAVVHCFDSFGWLCAEQVLLNGGFPAPTFAPPLVSVVDEEADLARDSWNARHPDLQGEFNVRFHARPAAALGWGDPDDSVLQAIEALAPPSVYIFAGADAGAALAGALALRDAMRRGARSVAPILVRAGPIHLHGGELARPSGVMQLRLDVFDPAEAAAALAGVAGSPLEQRARAIHAAYAGSGSHLPFDRLPHSLRLSNRRAAFHFLERLRLLGFEEAGLDTPTFGLGEAGLAWLRDLPEAEKEALDAFEHQRWRMDRLLEGWRPGPRDAERRQREQIGIGLDRYRDLPEQERGKDRSQLAPFVAMDVQRGRPGSEVLRVADCVWEGPPPRWSAGETVALALHDPVDWGRCEAGTGAVPRIRFLVPRLPEGICASADERCEALRGALDRFARSLLRDGPPGARIRLEMPGGGTWDWLAPDPEGRIDGVTLPHFAIGFTGHRDPARLGDLDRLRDVLRDTLETLVPAAGATLVTGLAPGADSLMIDVWRDLKLGPITGIKVTSSARRTENGERDKGYAPDRLCSELVGPLEGSSIEETHHLAGQAILDRSTLLIAVTDGGGGGPGGTEALIGEARARKMLIRTIAVPVG